MRVPRTHALLLLICLALPSLSVAADGAATEAQLWQALARGSHAALMRHALAPGTGDPAGFELGDCSTQRNLSDQGRDQARRIGERFRSQGIQRASVWSSEWCRCLETARLLGLGPVRAFEGLSSFFRNRQLGPSRTQATTALLRERLGDDDPTPLVLVTHQVNITALTDLFPASGEIIVVAPGPGGLEVLGRIRP